MRAKEQAWTKEEVDMLREAYSNKPIEEIAEGMGRTVQSLRGAVYRYGIKSNKLWTEEQDAYLEENYSTMRFKDMIPFLDKTESAISQRAVQLKLQRTKTTWSKHELAYLTEKINSDEYGEIAEYLGRTLSSVYNKVYELDLDRGKAKGSRTLKLEQQLFIVENYERMTDMELANQFNCSEKAIVAVRKKYDISKERLVKNTSNIETIIEDLLIKNGIPYKQHQKLDIYEIDYLVDDKLAIEVMGDYFHCNPYIYGDGPKNESQIRYVINDYYKKCKLLSAGYKILYLWEYDINNNIDDVELKIKNFCRPSSKP